MANVSTLAQYNQMITAPRTQTYLDDLLKEKKSSFVSNLTALVANSQALQACTPVTLMYAALKATALSLPFDSNLGFAYVIPYNNRKTGVMEAQFQMGYKGYIQLAMRTGQMSRINVREVKEGEIISRDYLSGDYLFEELPESKRAVAPIVGYVAFFQLTNGFSKQLYMSVDELKEHGMRYSQTFGSKTDYIRNNSKWATDFDAMAKKTVLKMLLSRYAPLSPELADGLRNDQAVFRSENAEPDYVDNDKTALPEKVRDAAPADLASYKSDAEVDEALLMGAISEAEAQEAKEALNKK